MCERFIDELVVEHVAGCDLSSLYMIEHKAFDRTVELMALSGEGCDVIRVF